MRSSWSDPASVPTGFEYVNIDEREFSSAMNASSSSGQLLKWIYQKGACMSKEKVFAFSFEDEVGRNGFVVVSADNQLRAIPFMDSIGEEAWGQALNDFEILTQNAESVMQKWEEAGYTQLSDLAVFFDFQNGTAVRPLRKFPGGDIIGYVAAAPGPVYSTGATREQALAKLGTRVPSPLGAVSASEAQVTATVNSLQTNGTSLVDPVFSTQKERRERKGKQVEGGGGAAKNLSPVPKKKG
jgi:hypothetical protein